MASGFFLGAMSLFSDYHVSRSNLDRALFKPSEPSGSDFIIKYSNPKIDGETTYENRDRTRKTGAGNFGKSHHGETHEDHQSLKVQGNPRKHSAVDMKKLG